MCEEVVDDAHDCQHTDRAVGRPGRAARAEGGVMRVEIDHVNVTVPVGATESESAGGGGGSRTPVFRVFSGTSPSAAGGLVSDPHRPSAACADPNPAVMSRRATGPVPAVSCSIWRSGSGRAAGPGGTSL